MDIADSCLFKKGSEKRLILLVTLHLLPLPINVKKGLHFGVVCSSIRTKVLRNKIKNFRVKITNTLNILFLL